MFRTLVRGIAAAFLVFAVYWAVVRPWHLKWGTTPAEYATAWPGTELIANPATPAIHAITIQAPPERIWPWIRQIGRERAGFYSYTWLENLFGGDIHNVYVLMPEAAEREIGESVWMAPRHKFEGKGRMVVVRLIPGETMVLANVDSIPGAPAGRAASAVWSFTLRPVDARTTRLVMCATGSRRLPLRQKVVNALFWEPAHFVMERKMMLTLKELSERNSPQIVDEH
jgi:hypothetical protein